MPHDEMASLMDGMMSFFGLFVIGAMLVGCGAMLSPAWPTREPRIGLAGTLSLALVMGGAVFWAFLFGWDTLVVDYLLFALVSLVVLGGTFSQGQMRAEAHGEELLDKDQGWTGPEDLVFFGLVAILCAAPLVVLSVPLDSEAAQLSLITLAVRDGGTFTSLAPYFPETDIFVEPGFHAISAYLSQQLGQPVPVVHQVLGAVVAFLCVWTAYDIGGEWRSKAHGRACAVAAIILLGASGLVVNGAYPQLMGVLFVLAFVVYALRVYREALWLDVVGAGLMMGATLYVSISLFLVTFVGFSLLGVASVLQRPISPKAARVGGILLVALAGTFPWWLRHLPDLLLESGGAWEGVGYGLLPLLIMAGGYGLLRLGQALPKAWRDLARRTRYVGLGVAGVALVVGVAAASQVVFPDQPTPDDLAAWAWLRENAAPDALLVIHPDDVWTVPFAERNVVLFGDPVESRLDDMGVEYVVKVLGRESMAMPTLPAAFAQGQAVVYAVAEG